MEDRIVKVRKVRERVPEDVLMQDLERYRQMAIELGAIDAKIIPVNMVTVDDRVRAKCMFPKCEYYGTNANCPPYSNIDPEQTRRIISRYRYAIFLKVETPTEALAWEPVPTESKSKKFPQFGRTRNEIVAKIEARAFYDGYYFALGFAGGPCKRHFCPNEECAALKPGQPCRFSFKARPAMEGVGIDVYGLATRVGWDIYPIGVSPTDAPCGTLAGIVFIY